MPTRKLQRSRLSGRPIMNVNLWKIPVMFYSTETKRGGQYAAQSLMTKSRTIAKRWILATGNRGLNYPHWTICVMDNNAWFDTIHGTAEL